MNRIEEAPESYDLCGQIILGPSGWNLRKSSACQEQSQHLSDSQNHSVHFVYSVENENAWGSHQRVSDRINRMNRIEGQAKEYDLCGQVIGAATGIDEGLLLNFGAERLEYKKKFRLPKQGQVSF